MFDEFLLLSTALVGLTLLRSSRRAEARPRGYNWVLAGILALTLVAVAEESRFVGVVAMAMTGLVVVAPWCLEWVARICFGRGMLRLAVWSAGLRSMLMLGAGLGRQQQILHGLAVLEREGVDRAIGYFRGLAGDTEDEGELALINEQIVSMLLYGQRWDDGIRHYESRFPPGHAAVRPALVLGLLRAYGEVGSLDRAAELLRALEEGPVGNDPRALGLVSQARLTFLVFAGREAPVQGALAQAGLRQLGLSDASGALFRGLVARQAGDAGRARSELEQVEGLAGRRDDRVVESARRAIGELGAPPVVLEPVAVGDELSPYVEAVASRLEAFLRMAPAVQRSGVLLATPGLLVAMGLGYFAVRWLDDGGLALLRIGGSLPETIRSGALWGLWTGAWVHGDPLGLLLDLYTIWFAAPLVERMAGTARAVTLAVVGAAVGVLVSAWLGPQDGMVLGGGGAAATALLAGAVALLFKPGDGGVRQVARRRLMVPLVMVAVAQAVSAIPGFLAVEASWHALLAAVVVGATLSTVPSGGRMRWPDRTVAAGLGLVCVVGLVRSATTDPLQTIVEAPRVERRMGPVLLAVPRTFEPIDERQEVQGLPLPVQAGAIDGVAMRAGSLVQVAVVVPEHDDAPDTPGLLLLEPALAAELTLVPTEVPAVFVDAGLERAEAHWVRRNGARLGLTVSTRVGPEAADPRVVLFAPEGPLNRQGTLYAEILTSAVLHGS